MIVSFLLLLFVSSSIGEDCLKESDVIAKIIQNEQAKDVPDGDNEDPLVVSVDVFEITSVRVVPHTNHLRMDMHVSHKWKDANLYFSHLSPCKNYANLVKVQNSVWIPSVLGSNAEQIVYHKHSLELTVVQNGSVTHSQRIQHDIPCRTEALNYPFGETVCTMIWKNEAASRDSYVVQWQEGSQELVLENIKNRDVGDLRVVDVNLSQSEVFGSNAAFDELTLTIHLKRGEKKVILLFFLPSLLFMAVSWLSLSLGPMAITRSLLITSTLILLLVHYSSNAAGLPETTGITAIDVWKIFSFLFVISILFELIIVTCMASMGRSRRLTNCCQTKKRKGQYALEPLYEELNDLRARRTRRTCGCCRYSALLLDFFSLWVFGAIFVGFGVLFYMKSAVAVKWLNDINLDEITML